MGELKFVGALLMTIVFAIAVVSYAVNFANDNSAAIDLSSEEGVNTLSSSLNSETQTFSVTRVNSSSQAFFKSTIKSGDELLEGGGQFKVGINEIFTAMKSIFSLGNEKLFGGNAAFGVVFTVLLGFLIYMGVRYIYKTWVGRNPD